MDLLESHLKSLETEMKIICTEIEREKAIYHMHNLMNGLFKFSRTPIYHMWIEWSACFNQA